MSTEIDRDSPPGSWRRFLDQCGTQVGPRVMALDVVRCDRCGQRYDGERFRRCPACYPGGA